MTEELKVSGAGECMSGFPLMKETASDKWPVDRPDSDLLGGERTMRESSLSA